MIAPIQLLIRLEAVSTVNHFAILRVGELIARELRNYIYSDCFSSDCGENVYFITIEPSWIKPIIDP